MQPKLFLMPFTGNNTDKTTLRYALALTKQCHAHLECLHISPNLEQNYEYYGNGEIPFILPDSVISSFQETVKKQLKRAHNMFNAIVETVDITLTEHLIPSPASSAMFSEQTGSAVDIISARGRMADMILISKDNELSPEYYYDSTHAAIFSTGRPVVIIPPDFEPEMIGQTVALAWDNTPHTIHALAAMMPFLSNAQKVFIFTVTPASHQDASLSGLLHYLQMHQINAEHIALPQTGQGVGETLQQAAKDHHVDLLAMGAFSHNRLHQLVMGSVTKFMLEHTDIPVLMMH